MVVRAEPAVERELEAFLARLDTMALDHALPADIYTWDGAWTVLRSRGTGLV
jgi:hypothetical protein